LSNSKIWQRISQHGVWRVWLTTRKRASIHVNETMINKKEVDDEGNRFDDDNLEDIGMEYMSVLAGSYEARKRAVVLAVFKRSIHNRFVECEKSGILVELYFDDMKTKSGNLKRFLCLATDRKRADFTVICGYRRDRRYRIHSVDARVICTATQ
jgi:hypothetical protein